MSSTPALLALAGALLAVAPGCTSHDCDASTTVMDAGAAGARGRFLQMGASPVWETSSWTGPWIDFPGNATLQINLPPGLGPPDSWLAWVSTGQYQSSDASFTATSSSGQLDEVVQSPPGSIAFNNNSCAEYYVRVVLFWYGRDAGASSDALAD